MASALPHQPAVEYTPRRQTDVVVDRDEPIDVLQAIASETARGIIGTLKDEPATASDIADAAEMSVQNVSYHLDRLCEAGLITPVETWYSKKGREMTVYALATERLVVKFGSTSQTEAHDERRGVGNDGTDDAPAQQPDC